ncbi:MAG TPA: prepilin-type N-terminal cleavage/methylation domain-containing protein [bacterium]|nr:prepilin-type N-terminal cleavage/methylation domain-containing protein [bacterium]
MWPNTQRAFTLIELLIVVAIIGILAAIAVPNLLQAQTRSKVARVKADHSAYCTAVESYMIDHNTYPLDGDDVPFFDPTLWYQKAQAARLTTPVAYIKTILDDPFNTRPATSPGMFLLFPDSPPQPYAYMTLGGYPIHAGRPNRYGVVSVGPNGEFDSAANQGIDDTYDPTNGVVSRGDIIRYGPGGPGRFSY